MNFDAFISYSHQADDHLSRAIERGLKRLARPWYRPSALRVFRDETSLAVNPHLWGSIAGALVLPRALRDNLASQFVVFNSHIARHLEAKDGTHKLLLRLHDKELIECVLLQEADRGFRCEFI